DAARAARPSDKELFDTLWEHMQALVSVRADLPTSDMVAILGSMLRLSFSGVERGPEALNTVNLVIAFTRVQLERRTTFPDIGAASTTNQILSFLLSPLRVYQNPLQILDLKDYQRLLGSQSDYIQKSVSTAIVTAMLQRETIMSTVEQVKGVLLLCTKLIAGVSVTRPDMSSHKGSSSSSARGSSVSRTPVVDEVEIAEEQGLLARLVHQIRCEEPETQALALVAARNAFLGGRVEYTFPSIVTAAINIVHQYGETKPVASASDSQHDGAADNGEAAGESNGEEKQAEEDDDGGGAAQAKADAKAVTQIEEDIGEWRRKVQHLLRFIQMSIDKIPEEVTALRLSIMAAQAVASEQAFAGEVEIEEAAYELFVQAFTVYEERVSDSRVQYDVLMQLLGAVHTSRNFSKDNFETLAEKCVVYGKKLLKRPDQARAAYACAYLWWRGDSTTDNSDNVFEQLLRSHKIAEAVFDPAVRLQLLIELLNRAVILYERECSSVTPKYLTDMIQLIRSSLEAEDVFDDSEATKVRRLGAASNVSDSSPADPSSLWTPADESPREWIPRFFAETLEYIESGEFPGVRTNPL
ncbi:retromer complex subunit Vps35, partial [Spiromyces aspiralis]